MRNMFSFIAICCCAFTGFAQEGAEPEVSVEVESPEVEDRGDVATAEQPGIDSHKDGSGCGCGGNSNGKPKR